MATTTDPWGQTPLTAEGLARLGHPLSLSDFNQDATGYWRVIRGQKTYYPREWFDASGTFTGTGTQPGDRAGQDPGFFHRGTHWNATTGAWENPTNWANVIGLAAAGGVGAGIAAPVIAGALGGGGATLAGTEGAVTTGLTAGALPGAIGPSVAAGGASTATKILQGVGGKGPYDWLGPVVSAGLNLYGQQQQIGATAEAAQTQLEATKYAADAQAKAAAESLAFQRQQAAYDALVAESTRRANYDQWGAKQAQLGSVGQALGLPARAIPAYVPLPPSGLGAPGPGTAAPPTSAPQAAATAFVPGAVANNPTAAQVPQTPGPGMAPPSGADAAWWNAQDPRGSVAALFGGAAPTSQAILDRRAQIEAAGGQVSPANAEGVISKIYLPGVGWTRVLDGGVAGGPGGGRGTGWTYVPQGAAASAAAAPSAAASRYQPVDPLGSVQQYFLDPAQARGQLQIPTGQLGAVNSYLYGGR
jgi:hypothetical protein